MQILELMWWEGEPTAWAEEVALTPETTPHTDPIATAAWLAASKQGAGLRVSVRGIEALGRGRHEGALRWLGGEGEVELVVILRVFRRPLAPTRRKVMVLGVDGARPDAMHRARIPVLDGLTRHGTVTWDARSCLFGDTDSMSCWNSVFTGVDCDKHLVISNSNYENQDLAYASFMRRARLERGARVGVAINWKSLFKLMRDDEIDLRAAGNDRVLTDAMVQWLREDDPDVIFAHLDEVDDFGHSHGFRASSERYVQAIEDTDSRIGEVLDAMLSRPMWDEEDWLIVVVTDHGGEGHSHGARNLENQRIWLIVSGFAAKVGEWTGEMVFQMDVHPTVLAHLGVQVELDKLGCKVVGL